MAKYLPYTGIGSRETPVKIMQLMSDLARNLEGLGYTLRSGGAPGADTAFETGVKRRKEIYLPWRYFNRNSSSLFEVSEEAKMMASSHHPTWGSLKPAVRNLMGRNAYQVLGKDLKSPSEFVVCWTPDGCSSSKERTVKTGGTGLAISLASSLNIPIFNLQHSSAMDRLLFFIQRK